MPWIKHPKRKVPFRDRLHSVHKTHVEKAATSSVPDSEAKSASEARLHAEPDSICGRTLLIEDPVPCLHASNKPVVSMANGYDDTKQDGLFSLGFLAHNTRKMVAGRKAASRRIPARARENGRLGDPLTATESVRALEIGAPPGTKRYGYGSSNHSCPPKTCGQSNLRLTATTISGGNGGDPENHH